MRKTMTLAAVLAGLGGLLAMSQASRNAAPTLVPVARAVDGGLEAGLGADLGVGLGAGLGAYPHLAALHARAEGEPLSYEPARREREGDDDDQDESRR
ncbi:MULTISPECIES: hypothetical protein [unclassified Bradyrhizobium]|uniref:hypothetical protein n=1 Tax=unclassified Bradyrhizobium TaxID=2631580 RepID=UPI0028EE3A2B|nr:MULTISPECIES: hypothetical protein [unclassified Bradyrhizobium]